MKIISAIFAAIAIAFAPSIAAACATCFGASSARTIAAYYASTMLLSLMPFALIGGIILAAYLMRNRPVEAAGRDTD
jgi:hypothetical protein